MEDGRTCADVDECEGPDACSHLCINSPGSYHCDCHPGYVMEANGHHCKIRGKVLSPAERARSEVHKQRLSAAAMLAQKGM